jgi:hypothetical protein
MVSTDIRPFVTMFRLPAATVISPASPELPVSAVMPVGTVAAVPSIDSAPATVTAMLPPLPVPNVSVVIWPFGVIDSDPAVTVMLPALPVLSRKVSAVIPVVGPIADAPSIVRAPVTLTAMLPPLPAPSVSVVI